MDILLAFLNARLQGREEPGHLCTLIFWACPAYGYEQLAKKCAVKGAGLQRVQFPPGNWFAPPGSNRNGGGGNEAVGAFDVEGR